MLCEQYANLLKVSVPYDVCKATYGDKIHQRFNE